MNNQKHEYLLTPKVTKIPHMTNKKRKFEDKNTKKRFINSNSNRSTADVGGDRVTRGLQQQSLIDVQTDGELGELIKVMRVLQDFPEVQSINIIQGNLKEFSDTKRFVYLNDELTERKYVIAEVKLFSGKEISIFEVEREAKSLSTLIILINGFQKNYFYVQILSELIEKHGNWNKEKLKVINTNHLTVRHGKRDIHHRAYLLFQKLIFL